MYMDAYVNTNTNILRDCKTSILQWNLGLTFTDMKKSELNWPYTNTLILEDWYFYFPYTIVWPGNNVGLSPSTFYTEGKHFTLLQELK